MSLTLREITKRWQSAIKSARETKEKDFGKQAADAMRFYGSADHSFLYSSAYQEQSLGLRVSDQFDFDGMDFRGTVNLTSNVVEVFLPVLFHKYPTRTAEPRSCTLDLGLLQMAGVPLLPTDGQQLEQQQARLKLASQLGEHRLNSTPRELNLKDHARLSVLEAIVKGMGVLVGSVFKAGDGTKLFGLQHESIDHWFVDGDARHPTWLDAGFVVRERIRPVEEVEEDFAQFGLPAGALKEAGGKYTNPHSDDPLEDEDDADGEEAVQRQFRYYEVWSRIGMGQTLKDGEEVDTDSSNMADEWGKYCWLAIPAAGMGYEYPLNLPPEAFGEESEEGLAIVKQNVSWPVEFWRNRSNPWPCAVLGFHPKPQSAWCHSHMTPVMGIQKAIDWIMSFMMGRVHHTSRNFLAVPRDLPEDIKQKILHGNDLTLLEIDAAHEGTRDKLVHIVSMPGFNNDLWNLLNALKQAFEEGTGVTELNMAGRTKTQARSAAEMQIKRDMLSVRPDDMANAVDGWMSAAAKLEMSGAASLEDDDDIARVFNEQRPSEIRSQLQMQAEQGLMPPEAIDAMATGPYTRAYKMLISERPLDCLFSELDFSVESGSSRKPDQATRISNVDESAQMLLPQFFQMYQQTGDPTQVNAWVAEYAKSRDMTNWQWMMLPDMRQQMAMQQQQMMQQQAQGAPPQGGPPQEQAPPPEQMAPEQPPQELPPEVVQMLMQQGGM